MTSSCNESRPLNSNKTRNFFSFYLAISVVFFFISGCMSSQAHSLKPRSPSDGQEFKTSYQELSLAIDDSEKQMVDNFERKKVLMYRSKKYQHIHHRRFDLGIREHIIQGFENGLLSLEEKKLLLDRCGELRTLWEKQRKQLTIKRFQLGFNY